MIKTILSTILISGILISCSNQSEEDDYSSDNYYTQGNENRIVAEWEPAIGTMVVWPLCIPHKLVVELAKDNHLFTLVNDLPAKQEALKWYHQWGIDTSKVSFIFAEQGWDAWWVRDWGPNAVFTPNHEMKLADGKYIYSTPLSDIGCNSNLDFLYKTDDNHIIKTIVDDNATTRVGKQLNYEVLTLPFINTGGNVLVDGLGTAFSTCILTRENEYYGIPEDLFFRLNKTRLGLDNYHVISNFEKNGIQHIDCYLKLLDEERILVIEPPKNHSCYRVYQRIIENEISKFRSKFGRPYEILRIKSERYEGESLAAYTNALILNKTIYVPLFNIKADNGALKRWKEVMPGYKVKGFTFKIEDEPIISEDFKKHYKTYGWNGSDGLHCRTRAVWDSKMLFITVNRISKSVKPTDRKRVYVTIIDYDDKGIVNSFLHWRKKGQRTWKFIPLSKTKNSSHFYADIPSNESNTIIEYYVTSISRSGRKSSKPTTAPLAYYNFLIKKS